MSEFVVGYTIGLAAGIGAGIAIGMALINRKKPSKKDRLRQKKTLQLLLIGLTALAITLITAFLIGGNMRLLSVGVIVTIAAILLILAITMRKEHHHRKKLHTSTAVLTTGIVFFIMGVTIESGALWPIGLVLAIVGAIQRINEHYKEKKK